MAQPETPLPQMKLPPSATGEVVLARGLQVWYQGNYDVAPNPAIVTHVWPNEKGLVLNMTVFDRDGEARAAVRVSRGASPGTWRPVGATE